MTTPNLLEPQLFLDDTWIEDSAFVARCWHQPQKYPEPVLVAEHPWERWCPVLFGSVMRWNGQFHMWYCTWSRQSAPRACYARSDDGVAWEKPALGICEFNGNKENNIILQPLTQGGIIDDLAVIDDPTDEEWPLKMLFWESNYADGKPTEKTGISLARSQDGTHWDRSPGVVLPAWGDRFNAVPSKVGGKYVLLGRILGNLTTGALAGAFDKGRCVWRIESPNLSGWSEPDLVLAADAEDPAHMQYYSATAFPYGGLMMGSIERMHMSPDKLDTEIIWSYDEGHTWQRARTRPSFISWGAPGSWDGTWINLPSSAPIEHENRLWFYYSGRSGAHNVRYPLNHGGIGLATLRIDGFASLHAEEQWGYVLTRPLEWPEAELHLNHDPRRDLSGHPGFTCGEVGVEVRDELNHKIDGFSWDDCMPMSYNTLNLPRASMAVEWKGGRLLRELSGRRLRFAFRLRDCHLFSFRAQP